MGSTIARHAFRFMSDNRVVITGLGLISPIGNSPQQLWDSLLNRKSGIDFLKNISGTNLPSKVGGEATEFTGSIGDFGDLDKPMTRAIKKGLRLMCREIEMGVAAAQLALQHSKVGGTYDSTRFGTIYGSDYILTEPEEFTEGVRKCSVNGEFDFNQWAEKGIAEITPLWLLKYLPNMPASHIAIYNDFQGPSNSITLREASGNLAISESFCTIQRDAAAAIVAGSTGTRVHAVRSLHVSLQEVLSTETENPTIASRPFDKNRTGMVMGEGAGSLVLEKLDAALERGATIYGEISGYGSSTVMSRDGIPQFEAALKNSMAAAIRTSGISPDDIGHVNAHGLSCKVCDVQESKAINEIFGGRKVPVVALKSYMGNLGAGSGMVELIASLIAMQEGKLFPTLNLDDQDPECDINVVATDDVEAGDSVLATNVTLQGQASAIIIKKYNG